MKLHRFSYLIPNQSVKIFLFCFFVAISSSISAQQPVKKIEIVHTDILRVDQIHGPDVEILVGHVILKHDSALMFCDSSYYNTKENNFTAFGKIHVQSPTEDMKDTVHLWGESLDYIGKDKLALVRKNVVLKKDSMTLYTQALDYDIGKDIGNYVTGGRTINGQDTLISQRGYFYANEDLLFFKEKVRIYNPKYTLSCDTLKHNTKKKISYIVSPTNIVAKDTTSSFLYCENGTYNHQTDVAQFQKNAYMVHGKKTLKGDSLYYDRKNKIGKAYNNVFAIDSTQKAILKGDYGEYHEKNSSSLLTKRAVFIQIQKKDSLYLHADTLLSLKDTLRTKKDTTAYSLIKGFHKVKLFKSDFQAKCDSLVYSTLDSTIELHHEPVLWSEKNQLTSKFVKILTKNNAISEVRMFTNSLIVSQSDTIRFDQIRGKNMIAYISNDTLRKIKVEEEGAAIYFGREKEKLIGVNKVTCKNMIIYLDSNKVDRIWFYEKPDGTMYPPYYLKEPDLKFDIFEWDDYARPKNRNDIFVWETPKGNAANKKKSDKVIIEKIESKQSDIPKDNKKKEAKGKDKNTSTNTNQTNRDTGKKGK